MQPPRRTPVKVGILLGMLSLALVLICCSSGSESGVSSQGSGVLRYAALGEGGPHPPPDLAMIDTLHFHRAGAQLVLSYDWATNAFTGTVENTTKDTLRRVRIEVHLSNGTELGPTTPVDLAPGQVVTITLPVSSQSFTLWSAYLEVG